MLKEQGNTWATTLKENSKRRDLTQGKLRNGIFIILMTTRSSHICSHQ